MAIKFRQAQVSLPEDVLLNLVVLQLRCKAQSITDKVVQ